MAHEVLDVDLVDDSGLGGFASRVDVTIFHGRVGSGGQVGGGLGFLLLLLFGRRGSWRDVVVIAVAAMILMLANMIVVVIVVRRSRLLALAAAVHCVLFVEHDFLFECLLVVVGLGGSLLPARGGHCWNEDNDIDELRRLGRPCVGDQCGMAATDGSGSARHRIVAFRAKLLQNTLSIEGGQTLLSNFIE